MKNKLNNQDIEELKNQLEFYKTLLINIYKAADYLGTRAELRLNDLYRDSELREKDLGSVDAYDNIKNMIIYYDSLGSVDYYKSNNVVKDLPYILQ